MRHLILAATAAAALSAVGAANATVSIGGSLAFTPTVTIDFEQASEGASLDSYYAGQGVTFDSLTQTYGYAGLFPPDLSGGGAINFYPAFDTSNAANFSIDFSSVQSNAGFAVVTDFAATFSTYLDGSLVETAYYTGGHQPGADIISFTNSSFNSIEFVGTGDDGALIDNLAFDGVSVPEPAAWALMLIGFGALGISLRSRRVAGAAGA
jgi:opacity protein-like surface antigen